MTKETAMHVKNRNFCTEETVLTIAFLQYIKAACSAYTLHNSSVIWLFRYWLAGPIEETFKSRVAHPTKATKLKESCSTSFSAIVEYLLKRFVTDGHIAVFDANIQNFKKGSLDTTDYAEQIWMKTLRERSAYSQEFLKSVLVEGVHRQICRTICQW